ncbi:MAG TPA: GxxExxY protein [Pyrinomonadaceae bacterium]|nr:GxxExxY protein [Pyrinomonadaceae bacterium]
MNTDLRHFELTQRIIAVFYEVYNELGHGFLESVYQESLMLALKDVGITAQSPIEIPVWFRGHQVGKFEGDVLVEKCVLLELKAARTLDSSHKAQLLNYLRATEIEIGLLLNFGVRPEIKRLIYDNPRKKAHYP